MRKIIIAVLIMASVNASAQSDKTIKDSVPSLTDSTALITVRDYDAFLKELVQDLPARYADPIRTWWIQRFQLRIQEQNAKPKKK